MLMTRNTCICNVNNQFQDKIVVFSIFARVILIPVIAMFSGVNRYFIFCTSSKIPPCQQQENNTHKVFSFKITSCFILFVLYFHHQSSRGVTLKEAEVLKHWDITFLSCSSSLRYGGVTLIE